MKLPMDVPCQNVSEMMSLIGSRILETKQENVLSEHGS
jgi:hypothetical protein